MCIIGTEMTFLQPEIGETTRRQKLDLIKMARDFCNRKEEPPDELIRSLIELLQDAEDEKLARKVTKYIICPGLNR